MLGGDTPDQGTLVRVLVEVGEPPEFLGEVQGLHAIRSGAEDIGSHQLCLQALRIRDAH